jgi:hypothetical protein
MWSNHVIPLKGSERKSFSGYITLPIPLHIQQSGWGWQYLKVEMRIRGKDGLYSKPVTHELVIGEPTPSNETLPPEWQSAENHQLGIVFFNFEFQPMGEGSGGETH